MRRQDRERRTPAPRGEVVSLPLTHDRVRMIAEAAAREAVSEAMRAGAPDPMPVDAAAERLLLAAVAEGAPVPGGVRPRHFAVPGHGAMLVAIMRHRGDADREDTIAAALVAAGWHPDYARDATLDVLLGTPAWLTRDDLERFGRRVLSLAARRRALLTLDVVRRCLLDTDDDPGLRDLLRDRAAELAAVVAAVVG